MKQHRRFEPISFLKARLAGWVNERRERVAKLRPGPEKDTLLERSAVAKRWADSTELTPPETHANERATK
ncbi:MAG: hypothetical protein KGK01_13040 [Bradyrhizobium sp.]|uniref:hypothetical protein n=1 Tax=Bradyrhizobium sp. TaxID=376 RepID=UPI00238A80FC|nr:hypothetical protein [Bradyrhizobium sp.]MDE2243321.1 hypothetical protein [Bradyrhizobium sp.]MDE2471123.1 hypothetical protein [Bradyrhizobium sp.]